MLSISITGINAADNSFKIGTNPFSARKMHTYKGKWNINNLLLKGMADKLDYIATWVGSN